jgi:hypothetical protein
LRSDAERALAFLRDENESGVIVVTLPEEMPTNETLELVLALRGELAMPVAEIVANALVEPLFSEAEARLLEPFAELPTALAPASSVDAVLASAARRALAERTQAESLERLAVTGLPIRRLPRLDGGAGTHEAVLALSTRLP